MKICSHSCNVSLHQLCNSNLLTVCPEMVRNCANNCESRASGFFISMKFHQMVVNVEKSVAIRSFGPRLS